MRLTAISFTHLLRWLDDNTLLQMTNDDTSPNHAAQYLALATPGSRTRSAEGPLFTHKRKSKQLSDRSDFVASSTTTGKPS